MKTKTLAHFGFEAAFDLQPGVAEIDQETNLDAAGVQVIDQLGLMFRGQRSDDLKLNQNFLFNQNVGEEFTDILAPE